VHLHLTCSGVACLLSLWGRQEHGPFTTRLRGLKLGKGSNDVDREGEEHSKVWTRLAHPAKRPTGEVQVCHTPTQGNKMPDADLCRSVGIASRLQERQVSLRGSRTVPAPTEGELELDQVASVCDNRAICLLWCDRHRRHQCLPAHTITRTAMSRPVAIRHDRCSGCTGAKWTGKGKRRDNKRSEQQENAEADEIWFSMQSSKVQGFPPFP
jgi:hypothetical protein